MRIRAALLILLSVLMVFPCMSRASEFSDLLSKARQGDARAQTHLGLLYATGKGMKLDYAEALKWFLRAANQKPCRWAGKSGHHL